MGVDSYSAVPTDGLVSMWSFSGDADDGWGDNDVNLFNGASIVGGKLVLDGIDDYVGRSDELGGMDFSDESYSISYWFYANTFDEASDIRALQVSGCEGPAYFTPYITRTSDSTSAITFYAVDDTGGGDSLNSGANSISINQWHHFAIVFDGENNDGELYIDNNLLSDGDLLFDGAFDCDGGVIYIGGVGTSRNLNGLIDDVMVYSRALSGEEVGAIYEAQRKDF
jgi:hypothetical protein